MPGPQPYPTDQRYCSAGSRIAGDIRTFVRRAQKTGSTAGKSILTQLFYRIRLTISEEVWGIEDRRITYVPELRTYIIAYTSYSRGGPGVSLALTEDFRSFERIGVVMPLYDKDAALFPRRFEKYWALIHRPTTFTQGAHMWISFSPDLRHWGVTS